ASNDLADVVLLEEPDPGHTGGAGAYAVLRVVEGDAAEREHGHGRGVSRFRMRDGLSSAGAGGAQSAEADARSAILRGPGLLKNRTEDGEVRAVGFGRGDLLHRVTRKADQEVDP